MKHARMTIALLLLCSMALALCSAQAAEYTVDGLFTVRYDDKAFTLDNATYADENVDDSYRWFFILYNDLMMFDASTERIDGFEDFSTQGADEAARQLYLDDLYASFDDQSIKLLTTVTAGESKAPFYVFSYENEDGPYLMAETVVNGYGIDFMAYYNDSEKPVDDALLNALLELVDTYAPARTLPLGF